MTTGRPIQERTEMRPKRAAAVRLQDIRQPMNGSAYADCYTGPFVTDEMTMQLG